tara:strand:+ start:2424 stop:2918 length:495 start_codon:yes stop_codon:yes gene_type:complete
MADPRRASTRRAIISYDHLKELTNWPNLLVKDYQGIIQDFSFLADEEDKLELRIIQNEEDIEELQADVIDLQLRVSALEYRFYEIITTAVSLTTEQFQTIICSNVAPINITLKLDPMVGDEVNIKRRGGSIVVIGTIDGFINKTINVLNYSMKLVFNGADWSEI